MADSAKQAKIAAAKKKLKQFKQKTGRNKETPKSSNATNNVINNDAKGEQTLEEELKPFIKNPKVDNPHEEPGNLATANHSQNSANDDRTTASTESLHHISQQLNGLISESQTDLEERDVDQSRIMELERRNRDLAALLEKHTEVIEQQKAQIDQLRDHAGMLQQQLTADRSSFTDKHKNELAPLKEQLQVHIQTIGILVAEKTELQSQLSQASKVANQRLEEIEEISGRLKSSRQRVSDLEKNLSANTTSSGALEKNTKELSSNLGRLKEDLSTAQKHIDELKQQNSELAEKLHSKNSECDGLLKSSQEMAKKLEMAELYAQQLMNQTESSTTSLQVVEELQNEKEQLLRQVHHFNEALKTETSEKDQIKEQYTKYFEQLQSHNNELTQQVYSLTEERESLLTTRHELEGAVLELQRKLEDVHTDSIQQSQGKLDEMIQEKQKEIDLLRAKALEAESSSQRHVQDNLQLSRFLEEREEVIVSLERQISEMKQDSSDRENLLEKIQNDKAALSRALSQNKELKSQLAELQNAFVKLSNDNMELMTKVQFEEHLSKELQMKVNNQEDEMKALRDAVAAKEGQLSELELSALESKKASYHQEQIHDRLRHYQAQAQLVETLQRELHNSQDMIDALKTQNNELRTMLIKASEEHKDSAQGPNQDPERDQVVDSLKGAIRQLESERDHLNQALTEQRHLSDDLSVKVSDLEELLNKYKNSGNENISPVEYEQLKTAMEKIQEKYSRVMRDKAELSDKADQLEHIVLQLQGETDTIGEYISLYHHQRALLQQRENQKNEYIAHLAKDREQMQTKLSELQQLVMQLLGEKNLLNKYSSAAGHALQSDAGRTSEVLPVHLMNGQSRNNELDWPDYTSSGSESDSEVEAIIGGRDTPTNEDNSMFPAKNLPQDRTPLRPHSHSLSSSASEHSTIDSPAYRHHVQHHQHHHRHPHHHSHHSKGYEGDHEHVGDVDANPTATKILNLISQIGQTNYTDKGTLIDQNFLPCKYCKGQVQII